MDLLHKLFYWHTPDIRILWRNKDGSVVAVACANCECPKDAIGYNCLHRTRMGGYPYIECGTWDGYEVYDAGFDGPVVGHRDPVTFDER